MKSKNCVGELRQGVVTRSFGQLRKDMEVELIGRRHNRYLVWRYGRFYSIPCSSVFSLQVFPASIWHVYEPEEEEDEEEEPEEEDYYE